MEPIRVMLIDEHEASRAAIASLIERADDMVVAASLSDGHQALCVLRAAAPDVVVMDQRGHGPSGAALATALLGLSSSVAIVVLAATMSDEPVHACLAAGARAYLLKETAAPDLLDAIRAVARGESVLAPQVVDRVVEWARRAKTIHQGGESLLAHEVIVLGLAANGLRNRDIAKRLSVSETTAKSYLRSAMRKLGVTDRAQAVAAGIRRGVI